MQSLVLLQRDHEASPHLRALIADAGAHEVLGVCHTVAEARTLLADTPPDLFVTDLRVQDGPVHGLLTELKASALAPRPHVLVTLVSHDDAAILEAVQAGADGYWTHSHAPALLLATLHQLARGESPMSPNIARQVLNLFDNRPSGLGQAIGEVLNPLGLTGWEREILQWLARGYLIDEVAQHWQSNVHSLACGIRRVYRKLQLDLQPSSLRWA